MNPAVYTAPVAALKRAHIERIALAVQATLEQRGDVVFKSEFLECNWQFVWYRMGVRHVVLTGAGMSFQDLVKLARQEFCAQLATALGLREGKFGAAQ